MSIIPAGYAEVVIPHRHSALARPALIVFGVNFGETFSDETVTSIQGAYHDNFGPVIDNSVTIGPTYARAGQSSGDPLVFIADSTAAGEASRSDSLNPGQAVLMHKRTARGGRRGRGRMYVPWAIGDDSIDEVGLLSSGAVSAFNTRGAGFLADLDEGPGCPMVVLHAEGSSSPGSPNEVHSLTVDPLVGSQRRRLGR